MMMNYLVVLASACLLGASAQTISTSAKLAEKYAGATCIIPLCLTKCEYGYEVTDEGCRTCDCRRCPKGEEYHKEKDMCVPVTCDSPKACDADTETCVPTKPEKCEIGVPCPAFICRKKRSCKLSEGTIVPHGYIGSGEGNNFCNRCFCNDGLLACTKLLCCPAGHEYDKTLKKCVLICKQKQCEKNCKLSDGTVVPHGWSGRGLGKNYCNYCRCAYGTLACTKRSCCEEGELWNARKGVCVPLTCASSKACPAGTICVRRPQNCSDTALTAELASKLDAIATDDVLASQYSTSLVSETYCPQFQCLSCPLIKCTTPCRLGYVEDKNGCMTCECRKCPLGEVYSDRLEKCVPETCLSTNACSDDERCLTVFVLCDSSPSGVCVRYKCIPKRPCKLSDGSLVRHGFLGMDKCNLCKCNDGDLRCTDRVCCADGFVFCPERKRCVPECKTEVCELFCKLPNGKVVRDGWEGESDCRKCFCRAGILSCTTAPHCCAPGEEYSLSTNKCVPVSCRAASCPTGTVCSPVDVLCKGSDPCRQYQCVNCPLVLCAERCRFGYAYDENGCQTCDCLRCPAGEEFDTYTHKCVPVSCRSENACDSNEKCVPKEIACVRAPCPQFVCMAKRSCKTQDDRVVPHGTVYNYKCNKCYCNDGALRCTTRICCDKGYILHKPSGTCVPLCRDAPCESPCPLGNGTIVPHGYSGRGVGDNFCNRCFCAYGKLACTDRVCCPKGEEYSKEKDACVPISCASPRACPVGKVCYDNLKYCAALTYIGGEVAGTGVPSACAQYVCKDCPQVLCKVACKNGYKTDKNGCQTCECKTCPHGEEFDSNGKCVPVTCRSENACKEDEVCIMSATPVMCVTGPCRQFKCRPLRSCLLHDGVTTVDHGAFVVDKSAGASSILPLRCNKCYCYDGTLRCTKKICCKDDDHVYDSERGVCVPVCVKPRCDRVCTLTNGTLVLGPWSGYDQCNKCRCDEDGNLACTERVCCPPGKVYNADEGKCECPPLLACNIKCKYGYVHDNNGCPRCRCRRCPDKHEYDYVLQTCRPVCPNSVNTTSLCPASAAQCVYGHQVDDEGCPVCKCKPCPPALTFMQGECKCPDLQCDLACEMGFVVDEHGCKTCKCRPCPLGQEYDEDKKECTCKELQCDLACDKTGFVVDEQGCKRCKCKRCGEGQEYDEKLDKCVPTCGPVCAIFCEHGNVLDKNGCATCECNRCPKGQAYIAFTNTCVDLCVGTIECDLTCADGFVVSKDNNGCVECKCLEDDDDDTSGSGSGGGDDDDDEGSSSGGSSADINTPSFFLCLALIALSFLQVLH
eukprot:m.331031 g.331031  ORF g.331031 m.331031 type:complete len:1308 (+) comp16631_c0_seq1:221-4144(+)